MSIDREKTPSGAMLPSSPIEQIPMYPLSTVSPQSPQSHTERPLILQTSIPESMPGPEVLQQPYQPITGWQVLKQRMYRYWVIFTDHVKMDSVQAYREASRNKSQFVLGCSSIFVVVLMVSLLMTAISYAPVVFLTLSESQAQETDLMVTAGSWTSFDRVNYTKLGETLAQTTQLHVPRLSLWNIQLYDAKLCSGYNPDDPRDVNYTYYGLPLNAPYSSSFINSTRSSCQSDSVSFCLTLLCRESARANFYIINSTREKQLGIGRGWPFAAMKEGEIILHKNVARQLGTVSVGDFVLVTFYIHWLLPVTHGKARSGVNNVANIMRTVNLPLKIVAITDYNYGKLQESMNSVMYVEYDNIMTTIHRYLSPRLPSRYRDNFLKAAQSKEINAQVTEVQFTCAPYRVSCYLGSYADVAYTLINWSSDLVFKLGFQQMLPKLDVLTRLFSTRFFSAFLGLIFSFVVLLMSALSAFLIYSLLMVSVETKTFELGVYRMIGMSKWGVVLLIIIQALTFAVPAWVFGLIGSQTGWLILRYYLADLIKAEVDPLLTSLSVLTATALGLLVPIVGAVLPIRQALTGNLHDALDTRRSKTKAVVISIERTKGEGVPKPILFSGIVLTVFGFGIYYFLPLALIYSNLGLLFNIFLIILVGMVFGLVLLSMNMQPIVEWVLVRGMFGLMWFENKAIPKLIVKNLIAHRVRNRKTSIMYALSLGFIIFLTVAVRIELQSLVYREVRAFGGDIRVVASLDYKWSDGTPAGIQSLNEITEYAVSNPNIEDFSLISYTMQQLNSSTTSTVLTNVGRIVRQGASMRAIGPNLYNLVESSYLDISGLDPNMTGYTDSLSETLYTARGSYSLISGTNFKTLLELNTFDEQSRFIQETTTSNNGQQRARRIMYEPMGFLDSAPVVLMSSFPAALQEVGVSFPTMLDLMNNTIGSVRNIPIFQFIIKLRSNSTQATKETILRRLTTLVTFETVEDLDQNLAGVRTAQDTLGYIFLIITGMVLVIAFFSLNSSMYTNIMEQKREIGVMRALGIRKWTMLRLFVYEAFVLVFAASLLGTIIGIVMGWSMAAQRSVLTEVPLRFLFPWDLFLVVVFVSVGCAIVSTIGPVMELVFRRRLISILR